MRLAAIYNVWDGEELLEGSIRQIRSLVDEVIIVWQDKSNYGEEYRPFLTEKILFDSTLVKYEPNLGLSGVQNETIKRQSGIDKAKELKCTHFILMDCDEYYEAHEFERAKERIDKNDLEGTVVRLFTYYKYPTLRLEFMESYYVPFIHKLKPNTLCGVRNYPFWCDPTRGINVSNVALLDCVMHHYSWIRKDIRKKLNNSSAKKNFSEKISKFIEEFETAEAGSTISYYSQKLIEVNNHFGIEEYGTGKLV